MCKHNRHFAVQLDASDATEYAAGNTYYWVLDLVSDAPRVPRPYGVAAVQVGTTDVIGWAEVREGQERAKGLSVTGKLPNSADNLTCPSDSRHLVFEYEKPTGATTAVDCWLVFEWRDKCAGGCGCRG